MSHGYKVVDSGTLEIEENGKRYRGTWEKFDVGGNWWIKMSGVRLKPDGSTDKWLGARKVKLGGYVDKEWILREIIANPDKRDP
jgi:hypothetical protein